MTPFTEFTRIKGQELHLIDFDLLIANEMPFKGQKETFKL